MYLTLMSLVCFTNVYKLKRIICLEKMIRLTGMAVASAIGESYPCLLLANPKHHDALKILSNCLADIEARRKVG